MKVLTSDLVEVRLDESGSVSGTVEVEELHG